MRQSSKFPGKAHLAASSFIGWRAFHSLFVLTLLLGTIWTTWHVIPQVLTKAHAQGTTPIKHIVFIVKENHSFDSYFGRFPGAHGATTGLVKVNKVDQTINLTPLIDQSPDYCHGRPCAIADEDNGAMDHFNAIGACNPAPYSCYQAATQNQIPNYWDLASKYVLSDETYGAIAAATFPNRLYTIAGAAGSTINTSAIGLPTLAGGPSGWGCDSKPGTTVLLYNNSRVYPCFDFPTLADSMDTAGVSWKYYAPVPQEGGYIFSAYDAISHIRNGADWTKNVVPWQNFVKDAQTGNLPAFSWVVAPIGLSEHPPASVCLGENWSVQQINAVMQGSDWSSTAIFVSYDEWGGFYDHEAPVSIDPLGEGIRLPMTIISPYAHATSNPGNPHITHTRYESGSVLRFAEEVFNLHSLGQRDSVSNDMMDAFDFSQVWNPPDVRTLRTCTKVQDLAMPESD